MLTRFLETHDALVAKFVKVASLGLRGAAIALAAMTIGCRQPDADVAGRVGDQVITMRAIDDHWRQLDSAEFIDVQQALYDSRKRAFDDIVFDMLTRDAAKGQGVPVQEYLRREIGKRTKPVELADVAAAYQAHLEEAKGRSLEQMQASLTALLERQHRDEARGALLKELSATARVRLVMDAQREEVQITADDPVRGPAKAPVTIVEFSDYECPFCAQVVQTLKRLTHDYGDRVRVVWKDFPLDDLHPHAEMAAEAAHCAGDEKRYWDFHDRVFAHQSALTRTGLEEDARAVGLDVRRFATCLDSRRYQTAVLRGIAAGTHLGVDSTPTAFINGRRLAGARPYETFARVIDDELARAR